MREREQQERGILEAVAEPLLEGSEGSAIGLGKGRRLLPGEELAEPGANGGPSLSLRPARTGRS